MKRTESFLLGLLVGILVMLLLGTYIWNRISSMEDLVGSLVFDDQAVEKLQDSLEDIGMSGNIADVYSKYLYIDTILKQGYYYEDAIDEKRMEENAIKGYVDALGDPYTTYFSAEENTIFDQEMEGSQDFEGIGAVLTQKKDGLMVEEVLKDMPAFKAGLQPLDYILEVDGESLEGFGLHDAVMKIRGPKGTDVTLTVFRSAASQILELTVTREALVIPAITGELLDVDGEDILYVEIGIIGDDAKELFEETIDTYAGDFDGMILDLRGNGGGHLPIAVDIVSYFLPENELVTIAKYKGLPDESYRSLGFGNLEGIPLVVLIDGASASAAEIIAAALDERADALTIGTKTFGKGSVQTLSEIEGGATIKYTIGQWFTSQERSIDKVGLEPDIEIEFDLEQYLSGYVDNQLEEAKVQIIDIL